MSVGDGDGGGNGAAGPDATCRVHRHVHAVWVREPVRDEAGFESDDRLGRGERGGDLIGQQDVLAERRDHLTDVAERDARHVQRPTAARGDNRARCPRCPGSACAS